MWTLGQEAFNLFPVVNSLSLCRRERERREEKRREEKREKERNHFNHSFNVKPKINARSILL